MYPNTCTAFAFAIVIKPSPATATIASGARSNRFRRPSAARSLSAMRRHQPGPHQLDATAQVGDLGRSYHGDAPVVAAVGDRRHRLAELPERSDACRA